MSDHLPECIYAPPNVDPDKGIEWGGLPCICDRLRACEQRVRAEYDEYRAMLGGIEYGAERSWDYALEAAREAVLNAGLCAPHRCQSDALAAIDALRGEPL